MLNSSKEGAFSGMCKRHVRRLSASSGIDLDDDASIRDKLKNIIRIRAENNIGNK
jgi:hypothetical protein